MPTLPQTSIIDAIAASFPLDGILEDHKVGDQRFVHAPDGLETVQIVLAGLQLDVPRLACQPRAERMDALAAGFQQPCDCI